jgi:hypothetical protein
MRVVLEGGGGAPRDGAMGAIGDEDRPGILSLGSAGARRCRVLLVAWSPRTDKTAGGTRNADGGDWLRWGSLAGWTWDAIGPTGLGQLQPHEHQMIGRLNRWKRRC